MKRIRSIARLQARSLGNSPPAHAAWLHGSHHAHPRTHLSQPHALPRPHLKQYSSSAPPTLTPSQPLSKTPLHDLHLANGAKMVPFGGHHMPVLYASQPITASHLFTRSHASLFDVSHMVQRVFKGTAAASFLERITPSDVKGLAIGKSTLSALLWERTGGIVDDCIITRLADEEFYVVTNAACREKDDAYLEKELASFLGDGDPGTLTEDTLTGWGLIALQGPLSADILASVVSSSSAAEDLKALHFGSSTRLRIKLSPEGTSEDTPLSDPLLISRGGYTGEDGFEISIPPHQAVAVTHTLLSKAGPDKLRLAGLGARDSLRLEAGMCLYGHDLNDATTPVEAGLSWIIPAARRQSDAGYHGTEVIAGQLVPRSKGGKGVERRRVGLVVEGAPAREGAEIVKNGEKVGNVTSGCPSPSLGKNIAMGYIKDGLHKSGTEVGVVVRGKERKAIVTKMPFIATKYWKGITPA